MSRDLTCKNQQRLLIYRIPYHVPSTVLSVSLVPSHTALLMALGCGVIIHLHFIEEELKSQRNPRLHSVPPFKASYHASVKAPLPASERSLNFASRQ